MDMSYNSARESLQHLEILPFSQMNAAATQMRTSGAETAPLYENNQIFRVRDLKENSRNSRKALLAKRSWDTGEPDSGLCSELEQDVNKSAWVGCILEFSISSGGRAEICE